MRRARLLHAWEAAGLPVETIRTLVERGALSLAFLDAPVMATPERLDRSYAQLATDHVVSEDTARRSAGAGLRFEPLGPVGLKGVARALPLYRASRVERSPGRARRPPAGS